MDWFKLIGPAVASIQMPLQEALATLKQIRTELIWIREVLACTHRTSTCPRHAAEHDPSKESK